MRTKEYSILFLLAALWGASFLFIKVAVTDMPPLLLVFLRLALGTLGFLVIIPFQPAVMRGWRSRLGSFVIVTVFNTIIPYLTISWGEQHVASGMAAILNATTPLVLVIASIWLPGGERLSWLRLLAVLIGFVGVGVLVGPSVVAAGTSRLYLLGALSCFIGAASYAFGSYFAHKLLHGAPPMQQAVGQIGMGAILLAPFTGVDLAVQPLAHMPSTWAIASLLALSLGGTTLAYLCYFWLIENVGPTRTLIVTYLLPCMALVYGALFLQEALNVRSVGGLALVLIGVFLAGKKATGKRTNAEEKLSTAEEAGTPAG
ncbi:MAG TPA: DMT family transporter [Ktedonobacteraceae bacterium]|nr:DMT family transporter [Ktedonobacteraceae bacterium]